MSILKTLKKWFNPTSTKEDRYREIVSNTFKSPLALHRHMANRRWKINGSFNPESLEYVYCWIRR